MSRKSGILILLLFLSSPLLQGCNLLNRARQNADSEVVYGGVVGRWRGEIEVDLSYIRMIFNIDQMGSGIYTATLDSPTQNVFGVPANSVSFENNNLTLEFSQINGEYSGRLREDGRSIMGTWRQLGQTFELEMYR